jgi:hypothetical protein
MSATITAGELTSQTVQNRVFQTVELQIVYSPVDDQEKQVRTLAFFTHIHIHTLSLNMFC